MTTSERTKALTDELNEDADGVWSGGYIDTPAGTYTVDFEATDALAVERDSQPEHSEYMVLVGPAGETVELTACTSGQGWRVVGQ